MLAVGILVMKQLVWDLADSVDDHGAHLVIRRYGKEATIQLSNVMNGSSTTFTPKVPFLFNPFAKNAVAEGLIEQAFHARSKLATEDRMGRRSP
jgi:hypothetical protein